MRHHDTAPRIREPHAVRSYGSDLCFRHHQGHVKGVLVLKKCMSKQVSDGGWWVRHLRRTPRPIRCGVKGPRPYAFQAFRHIVQPRPHLEEGGFTARNPDESGIEV